MTRSKYNINELLIDIENTPNGIGDNLTYTSIYDDIKQARFEEDSTLSQGVWKHDLKEPNWELVEQLSVDAIQNKSKDLQIIGWLIESLLILDSFEGIYNGINILNEFIKKYWNNCYPLLSNNASDNDQKSRILEWIYETVYRRSLLLPILGNDSFSIYNYEYALDLNKNILKNPNNKNQIIESANKNNIKFLEDINNIINNIDINEIIKLNKNITNIKQIIGDLKSTLIKKLNNDRAFTKLINNINIIEKLISKRNINEYENNQSSQTSLDNKVVLKTSNNIEKNNKEVMDESINIIDNNISNNIDNTNQNINHNVIPEDLENSSNKKLINSIENININNNNENLTNNINNSNRMRDNLENLSNKQLFNNNKNTSNDINNNNGTLDILESSSNNRLINNIEDNNKVDTIKDNINTYISNNTEVINNIQENEIKNIKQSNVLNREEIYKILNSLYLLLKEVDKHSPSPYLLKLILEWKDKTLLEIITDVKTGNTESHQLLKMLLNCNL